MSFDVRVREWGSAALQKWRWFFFDVQSAHTLGLVRIAFGLLVVCWTLELYGNLYVRFSATGVVPQPIADPFLWSIFKIYPSDGALLVGWLVLMIAALALTVGWHSRVAAIVVFILVMSFERRDPWFFNAGDGLIRIEALLLALSPCGAAFSLDQRRQTGSFWTAQEKKLWALRLMQIQLSVIYISTVVAKLKGDTWQNGTAVSYSLRLEDMLLLPTPDWLTLNAVVANALTWGTLLVELAIGVLIWNKRLRPWVIACGVLLHLTIMLTIVIGFFSLAMFVLYVAFVPTTKAQALAGRAAQASKRLAERIRNRHFSTERLGEPRTHPEFPTSQSEPGVNKERLNQGGAALRADDGTSKAPRGRRHDLELSEVGGSSRTAFRTSSNDASMRVTSPSFGRHALSTDQAREADDRGDIERTSSTESRPADRGVPSPG